jgi:hypothetical protein
MHRRPLVCFWLTSGVLKGSSKQSFVREGLQQPGTWVDLIFAYWCSGDLEVTLQCSTWWYYMYPHGYLCSRELDMRFPQMLLKLCERDAWRMICGDLKHGRSVGLR